MPNKDAHGGREAERKAPFLSHITVKSPKDVPEKCSCPWAPFQGKHALKYVNNACIVHGRG